MKHILPLRVARYTAIICGVIIPSPLVLIYGIAAAFVGLTAVAPVRVPPHDRALAGLYLCWGIAGVFGFASVWYALVTPSLRPVKMWIVTGMVCALFAFGAFIVSCLLGVAQSRVITIGCFWPLMALGPVVISLVYLVCLPRLLKGRRNA